MLFTERESIIRSLRIGVSYMTEIRKYTKEPQDVLLTGEDVASAIARGALPEEFEVQATIAESKITSFCKGCDNFKGEGIPCRKVGSNNQARYADRNWCGWATVNGKRTAKQA